MRYSFSAIIEVWLSGLLFLLSAFLCFFRIFWETYSPACLLDVEEKWISIIVIVICSLGYSVGWALNHLAEQILDTLFQHPYRKKLEIEKGKDFYTVRSYVFQYGSDQILSDIKYDRQVIRIARSNCFNFLLMGLIFATYYWINIIPCSVISFFFILCLGISILSFFQWRSRYKATYNKFYQAYFALPKEVKPVKQNKR